MQMVVNMLEIIIELQIHLVKREREREMIYFEYIIYISSLRKDKINTINWGDFVGRETERETTLIERKRKSLFLY